MTDEYDPVGEHMAAFDRANADTIPAPPVPSSPPNAERDQLERKNRLLHGQIAKLEGRLAMLEAEYRLLLGACYEAAQALRSALDDNGGPFIPE